MKTAKKSTAKKSSPLDAHPQPKHRDGIEQLIIAIILAVLFRSFEAEAFIIPTGSMAPSLQGRHKDIQCPECTYRYRTGVSEPEPVRLHCPSCGYKINTLVESGGDSPPTFSGDRILVNKFAYQLGQPKRWDVIVFKNPGNAKQNYIKRLIGLPNETIRIRHGDVYIKQQGESDFEIERKPPDKVRAMLQFVHDTNHIPDDLAVSDWPTRWFEDSAAGESGWEIRNDRSTYTLSPTSETRWLHYRHVPPSDDDWRRIEQGKTVQASFEGELITDSYAYNSPRDRHVSLGWHWVGDLAVETDLRVQSDEGQLIFKLIEGGHHFAATFDISSGDVELTVDGDVAAFLGERIPTVLTAKTNVKGRGRHKIMFANVDDRLLLWVDGKLIPFELGHDDYAGAGYAIDTSSPVFTADDPGDLNPVRIGGSRAAVEISRLRVMRDIYYIACKSQDAYQIENDYQTAITRTPETELRQRSQPMGRFQMQRLGELQERRRVASRAEITKLMRTPDLWSQTNWFDQRATVDFPKLESDQFFPMGDNAPRSQDARLWAGNKPRVRIDGYPKEYPRGYPKEKKTVGHYVSRHQLIGKAFLIYWPHGWPVAAGRLPIIPNIQRMGRIK